MDADADIQVWLEAFSRCQPCLVVPYVKTTKDVKLLYRISAVREGPTGKSAITQAGTVYAKASQKIEISRFSINHTSKDWCQINIILTKPGNLDKQFQFVCPD